ncbi:MAG: hypothetical protein ACTHMY_16900 [Solirubrobacteraceae bacterium]
MATYVGPDAPLSDEEFLEHYEAHALKDFSHQDHLRMAFAYARRGGEDAAVRGARRIRGFAEALGVPGKYHDTLTVAWARIVGRLAVTSSAPSFEEFLAQHPHLQQRDLLGAHYSRDLLFSDAARAAFVEPDLAPLP